MTDAQLDRLDATVAKAAGWEFQPHPAALWYRKGSPYRQPDDLPRYTRDANAAMGLHGKGTAYNTPRTKGSPMNSAQDAQQGGLLAAQATLQREASTNLRSSTDSGRSVSLPWAGRSQPGGGA